MSPVLIAVALVLAVGLWGYLSMDTTSSTGSGGTLSASQIAQYAKTAGFQGDDLVTAVAVALAESSGNPQAVGDGGTSYGLWQIHWTVHPEFDKSQLFDPQYNANAAVAIYNNAGGTFNDWSAYNNNAYVKYLGDAGAAVSA